MLPSKPFILQKHPILVKPYGFNHRSILGRKKIITQFGASSTLDFHMISTAKYSQPAIFNQYGFHHHTTLGKKKVTVHLRALASSSSATQSWTYDVFLSFRGKDIRNNFLGHLYSNLVRKGIKTFLDDDGLGRGEEISPALHKAIEDSRISIVVFSENYASSKWCLEELVKILHCKESNQQLVYPVFYKVDPSDVRNQRGTFGQAFAKHESRFKDNIEQVMRWREALTKAANLSGMHFVDGSHENEFIDTVVEEVSRKLFDRTYLSVAKYPVGIQSRVEDVLKLLRIGENDAHMVGENDVLMVEENDVHTVGIWGVGGIGKSTIAKAVYNSIVNKFEASCYLENVRERSISYRGVVEMQKSLLSKILQVKDLEVNSVDEGITMIKDRLCHIRVLIILDDTNDLSQLDNLVGESNWFGSGSRIIITTRDKHWLTAHNVNDIYKVKELCHHEALELFNFHAFKENKQIQDYTKLIDNATQYAQGLPLALQVLGSYLRGRSVDQWEVTLDGYRREPKQEIQEVLKKSYDALGDLTKEIFLHIACFFKGKNKNYVIDILKGCGLSPEYGIERLAEKALININEEDNIMMHDLVEEMGKEIVFQESPTEPGKRSRLWHYEDVYHVFSENTGTDKVRGIIIDHMNAGEENIRLNSESFSKLKNLQVFISSSPIFTGDYVSYLPNELRLLDWEFCPLLSFPYNCNPQKLVVLRMPGSETSPLRQLQKMFVQLIMPWSCQLPLGKGSEIMQNLKSMDLSNCDGVKKLKLSRFPNLADLNLRGCKNLVEVEVGFLKDLVNLDLGELSKLKKFEIVGEMKSLKGLDLRGTAIKELPSSIGLLTNLEILSLEGCMQLTDVPCSIFELQHLQHLDLGGCMKLVSIPIPIESEFSANYSTSLQDKHYDPLFIKLNECRNLVEILEFPREIDGLETSCCFSLKRISRLSDIVEGKKSKMIPQMNLSYCYGLCENLEDNVAKKKRNSADESVLFSLFLSSCQQSALQVSFPTLHGVPKWFTCHSGSDERSFCHDFGFYFRIEFPRNFKWENKGLAFCAHVGKLTYTTPVLVTIHINRVCIIERSEVSNMNMWLHYIPFHTIIGRLHENGLRPPSICIVQFHFRYRLLTETEVLGSCGVHVVMPEDEGVFVNDASSEGYF